MMVMLEFKYENTDKVMAIPYDIPMVGYKNEVTNTLRLWSAEPVGRMMTNQKKARNITMTWIISIRLNKFPVIYIRMIRNMKEKSCA